MPSGVKTIHPKPYSRIFPEGMDRFARVTFQRGDAPPVTYRNVMSIYVSADGERYTLMGRGGRGNASITSVPRVGQLTSVHIVDTDTRRVPAEFVERIKRERKAL